MKRLPLLLVLVALPVVAHAQKPVTQTETIEMKAKIIAIDHTARTLTLKDLKDGTEETMTAGPEIKRFAELKVGDTVTFRYYESYAFKIRKPGDPAPVETSDTPAIVAGKGARPGGTTSQQKTATVTVKAIDEKTPAITVLTDEGHTVSFHVTDKNNLKGVKAGDKVEITYTEAMMISVQ